MMTLTTKLNENSNLTPEDIVNAIETAAKARGITSANKERWKESVDIICVDVAVLLGLSFTRQDDELIFYAEGLQ